MSADRPGSDHAFPHVEIANDCIRLAGGLTKRELIAAMAMQGLYAGKQFSASEREQAAHWSVEIADALLAQLSKETP